MYIKRADLIVWTLVLLTTTCLVLTHASSDNTNQSDHGAGSNTPSEPGHKPSNNSHPVESSEIPPVNTDQVTPPERDAAKKNKTGTVAPKDEDSSKKPPATNKNTEGILYYQITKRIKKCNLTLGDIREVLIQKADDGDQFMYTLADKLGYMVDGKFDDPHIPVIKSHKKKLITLLEMKKARLSTPPLQEQADKESAASDTPPLSSEPTSASDRQKVGFEVSKAIHQLNVDAIYDLLNDASFSDIFSYSVGNRLGYSANDEHMEYLKNKDVKELKNILQRILDSKMPNNNLSGSDGHHGTGGQGPGQQLSDPIQKDPTQGGGDEIPSKESHNDQKLSTAAGDDQSKQRGDTEDEQVETSDLPGVIHHQVDNNDLTKPGDGSQKSMPLGDARQSEAEAENDDDGGDGVREPSDGNYPPGNGGLLPQTSEEDKDHKESKIPQTVGEVLDIKTGNGGSPPILKDRPEEGSPVDNIPDDDNPGVFEGIDEQRMRFLNSEGFRHFLELKHKDAESDEIDAILDDYIKWKNDNPDDKEGGGGDGNNKNTMPEAKGGSSARPSDTDDTDIADEESSVEYSNVSSRSLSSFGTWHFLSIFLVLGAVVVIGYLCMHNRKKLREGVASYVNDSSKRRRRAREYKPLIST